MRVPIGILVLGCLALFGGLTHLLVGFNLLGWVTFGPLGTGNGIVFTGLLEIAIGAIYLGVAYAAWMLRPWAVAFGQVMAVIGLFNASLIMLVTGSLAQGLAAMLLPGVILWYLNSEGVESAFLEASKARRKFGDDNPDEAQRILAERSTD